MDVKMYVCIQMFLCLIRNYPHFFSCYFNCIFEKINNFCWQRMNLDKYELKSGEELEIFEFISSGPQGQITKVIQYTPINEKNVYNLGFGDKNLETGEIDDMVTSNNKDSTKVLATVVASLYVFTGKHKNASVYASGSTKARTRLYRMGITKYLDKVREDFLIYGQINDAWELFQKDINYEAFLITQKQIIT